MQQMSAPLQIHQSLQGISTQFALHTTAHRVEILDLMLCICSCSVPFIASMEQRVGVFRTSPSSEDLCLCCTVKCYMYNLELLSVGRECVVPVVAQYWAPRLAGKVGKRHSF